MQKTKRCADTKSGISQIPRGMAENTVEMQKDSAKSGNVGITANWRTDGVTKKNMGRCQKGYKNGNN